MGQYFDKDFFKFFMGFLVIVSISLVIIIASKFYQKGLFVEARENSASIIYSTEP